MTFPTGKPHISYSEVKVWKECSYRHKLAYVDKLDKYEANHYASFGTAVHNAIESYLLTQKMDLDACFLEIQTEWLEKNYREDLQEWQLYAKNILDQFPTWIQEQFPNYETISAEYQLYEPIEGQDLNFKGYVDCMLRVKNKKGKELLWVIDWKTTGKAGWYFKKKKEFISLAQVGLYKQFISKKLDIPMADIRCAYVFLKRGANPGKCIDLFPVSVGPKFVEKSEKLISSMIGSVKNGMALKNYNSCKFCPFASSEHCNGQSW